MYARVRRKGRGKRRKEGRRRRRKKEERRNTHNARVHPVYTRARPHPRALASVERPLTLHFVVGVFYAFYCLSFSAPFLPPSVRPRPTCTPRPPSRLTRPVKKTVHFLPSLIFLHDTAIRRPTRFLRPFSPGLFIPPLFTMQIKAGPYLLPFFFYGAKQPAPRPINDSENRVVEPPASVHSNEALRSLFRRIYSKSGDF